MPSQPHSIDVSALSLAGGVLLDRCESKYLLCEEQLPRLLEVLEAAGSVVEANGHRSSRYRTCYFDTREERSLRDAQQGLLPRWKVRCREYVQSGERFLEAKLTTADGVFKRRTPHASPTLDALAEPDLRFLCSLPELSLVPLAELHPVAVTEYERQTFLVDGARVTLDRDLSCRSDRTVLRAADVVVVETKRALGAAPTAVDRDLLALGVSARPFSKFSDARALLVDGRLPAGGVPWRVVSNRHG